MKKIFIIISATLAILLTSAYLLIPSTPIITETIFTNASETNVSKFLVYEKNWKNWWPGTMQEKNTNSFTFNDFNFLLIKETNSAVSILITNKSTSVNSSITFFPIGNLKERVTWTIDWKSNSKFYNRFSDYLQVKKLENTVIEILGFYDKFVSNNKLAYGYDIHFSKVKDSIMLVTSSSLNKRPDIAFIYEHVKNISQQISNQKAIETNYPMLNVTQLEKQKYQVTIAIPTNSLIKPGAGMVVNKMILGNILEATVTGGPNTILDAYNEIGNFMTDYHLTSPAMPFESMITNRAEVSDTSKWVSKIYYPIL